MVYEPRLFNLEIDKVHFPIGKLSVVSGVSGAGKSPKTAKEKARRKSFKARHGKNISKGRMSAAYWANKVKW